MDNEIVDKLGRIIAYGRVLPASRTAQEFGSHALATVRPSHVGEVQRLVAWASTNMVPLILVSSGPPHLHGGSSPRGPAVIVDMSGMDRIIRIDRKNRMVIIEPGVRFDRLCKALTSQGLRLPMPLRPKAAKSALAAYLEREPHTLPKYQWDHMDPLCCVEAVLGDSHLFRTGTAAGPGTLEQQWTSGDAQVNNMGPAQADFGRLFQGAQGTLGIVTWGSIRLEVLPHIEESYLSGADSPEAFIEIIHSLLRLRLADELFVLNRHYLAGIYAGNAGEHSSMVKGLPDFVLAFSLSGSGPLAKQQIKYRRGDVAALLKEHHCPSESSIDGISGKALLDRIKEVSCDPYWKLAMRGGFREVFFETTYDQIPHFMSLIRSSCTDIGYEPGRMAVYLQPLLGGRSCHAEFVFPYHPDDTRDSETTAQLVSGLTEPLIDQGAYFGRPYGQWADTLFRRDPVTHDALKRVKGMFDPHHLFNPGHLGL